MPRKNKKAAIGKNIVGSRKRPTNMDELIESSPKPHSSEKAKLRNSEKPKTGKAENKKKQELIRYEVRIDAELDLRFRRFMFEHNAKTNPTLLAALDEFLASNGY